MQGESSYKLPIAQGHELCGTISLVVFVAEGDFTLIYLLDAMVRDGYLVRISAEILNNPPGRDKLC